MLEPSYSLDEVAAQRLPKHWTDGKRWLARRLNRGELSGYKVGRDWMMTASDVADMVERRRNRQVQPVAAPEPVEPLSVAAGLSARSARSLKAVSA